MIEIMNLYWKIFNYFLLPHWIGDVFLVILKFVMIAALMVVVVLALVLLERKFLALLTVRKGPNRVGPWGLLQTVADAVKLLFKEDIIPAKADKILFMLAPIVFFFPVLVVYGLIPFAKDFVAINASCGLILSLAITSLGILGLLSAGWASNNKYSIIGAVRSVAQAISYELPMVFSALGVAVLAGSMNLNTIASLQGGIWGWYVFPSALGFLIFLTCTIAELNRTPFDLPEAESELVSGYNTEYSGMRFALFFLAEYAALFIYSALIVTMFFGGYSSPLGVCILDFLPFLNKIAFIEQFFWLMLKTFAVVLLIMWIRATLPRLRADQLMAFSWKFLLPLSFINLFWLAVLKFIIG